MNKILILGKGNCKERRIREDGQDENFTDAEDIVSIDIDPNCLPTIVKDMTGVGTDWELDFEDSYFDEIHAYDSLEHWGKQGDWRGHFDEFAEYHRILKDGGKMYIVVPINRDAFADPGHTRFFSVNHFLFLEQAWYDKTFEEKKNVTDYRFYWDKNFEVIYGSQNESHIAVVLQKKVGV